MNRYSLHIDTINHGKLELTSWRTSPLGEEALEHCLAGTNAPLPLEILGGRATNELGAELDWTKVVATFMFHPTYAAGPLALVPGGWLPTIVAGGHHLLVLDRHMAGELKRARASLDEGAPNSLLALITDKPVQLNVLAHVFEGNARQRPSASEIDASTKEVYEKLRSVLPEAILVPTEADAAKATVAIWNDLAESHARASAFLRQAWPDLRPVMVGRQDGVVHRLMRLAKSNGVRIRSLPFLAATLAACLPPNHNPAADLFKASGKQAPDGAVYNALSDLIHLQMVIAGNAYFPNQPIAFVTQDRALIRLWVGLGIHSPNADGSRVHFSMPLDDPVSLMGRLPRDVRACFLPTPDDD